MLILIAESKAMNCAMLREIDPSEQSVRLPVFLHQAAEIMASLAGMSVADIALRLGIGPKSAKAMADYIYDFTNTATGIEAVEAFTGVVFKHFDVRSLDGDTLTAMRSRLRIISSLYGWLRPDDIIKPYRLDFTSKAAPGGKPMYGYWRKDVTAALVDEIKAAGVGEVVNLLPMDASKCIDWKSVKDSAKVIVPSFKIQQGEALATPNATLLKAPRGSLLRHIICDRITDGDALRGIDAPDMVCLRDDPAPGHPLFVTA